MPLKHEPQGVVSGYGFVTCGEPIQSILNQLRAKKITIQGSEKEGLTKKQEEETLITLINQNNFWFINIDPSKYIGEGAPSNKFSNLVILIS
ncbi:MAG: hypothetical protein RL491_641 [Bacteroidota bacterium]|jgi:hypothetical protein